MTKIKKIPLKFTSQGHLVIGTYENVISTYQHIFENKIPFFCVQSVFPHKPSMKNVWGGPKIDFWPHRIGAI
jgi:hypothetical protein